MRSRLAAAPRLAACIAPAFLALLRTEPFANDNKPKAPGLGDRGQLTALVADTGRVHDSLVMISGRDAGQQLVVTGQYNSGQTRDLTRKSTYEVLPAGIVNVDSTGLIL